MRRLTERERRLVALLPKRNIEWQMIIVHAKRLGSDGCTSLTQTYQRWCYLHDCCYREHKLPWVDNALWPSPGAFVLRHLEVTRSESDFVFAYGMRSDSLLGNLSVVAAVRKLFLSPFGWYAWLRRQDANKVRQGLLKHANTQVEAP